MVNRADTNTARQLNTVQSAEPHSPAVHPHRRKRDSESFSNEDLIMSLANAHENKRARQVTEWEQMRRGVAMRSSQ